MILIQQTPTGPVRVSRFPTAAEVRAWLAAHPGEGEQT